MMMIKAPLLSETNISETQKEMVNHKWLIVSRTTALNTASFLVCEAYVRWCAAPKHGSIDRKLLSRMKVLECLALEGVQRGSATEEVGHGDVPGLHAAAVHCRRHLPVPIAALLPYHCHSYFA